MSLEKTERNELIAKLYNQGKTNPEILAGLQEKGFFDLGTLGSVRMQISRLRRAGKLPKDRPGKQVKKAISPQVDKSTSPLVHKRVTYYLTGEIIKKIKQIALNRDIDSSGLVREVLSEWISEQVHK